MDSIHFEVYVTLLALEMMSTYAYMGCYACVGVTHAYMRCYTCCFLCAGELEQNISVSDDDAVVEHCVVVKERDATKLNQVDVQNTVAMEIIVNNLVRFI